MKDKKMFADAKRTLKEFEKHVDIIEPKRLIDETKQEYVKRYRHRHREVLLNLRCPLRICPVCSKTKVKSRQWVIFTSETVEKINGPHEVLKVLREHLCVCRSCWKVSKLWQRNT